MDIGQKLKNARSAAGLTQEAVAESIGISRQTISNWENNRTYPDIISIIKLSDLYAITLDELLKGDTKVIEHLEESTNVVKARQRFSKLVLVIAYLVIWALSIIVFWVGGRGDAMGYSLVVLYLVLPVSTLVVAFFVGKGEQWGKAKWIMPLFFGILYMLVPYATFSLSNMIAFDKINLPEFSAILPGAILSALGIAIGTVVKKRIAAKKGQ